MNMGFKTNGSAVPNDVAPYNAFAIAVYDCVGGSSTNIRISYVPTSAASW